MESYGMDESTKAVHCHVECMADDEDDNCQDGPHDWNRIPYHDGHEIDSKGYARASESKGSEPCIRENIPEETRKADKREYCRDASCFNISEDNLQDHRSCKQYAGWQDQSKSVQRKRKDKKYPHALLLDSIANLLFSERLDKPDYQPDEHMQCADRNGEDKHDEDLPEGINKVRDIES